nr:hypothetical protein [Tanacetum cinerariifolium]
PKKKKLQEQIDAQVARELEEQQEKEDMRMNEQIARDAEVARIHAEEEIQGMIDSLDKSNEIIAKYLQEYQEFASELPLEKKIKLISDLVKYQEHYTKVHKFQSQQRRPMTKKQKREYYMAVEDFIPMGSKEETKRLKRKGLNLEKEQVKKQKSSEEAPEIETTTKEFTEEKIKEMMQLVLVEDVYVQALQVKHPIIDWKVHSEEEIARVLTFIDAATVLARGIDVPIGSGSIPTTGPPTTKKLQEQIDAQVARELEEQQEKENIRMNEQIARDAEVARIHAEEELQGMIDSLDKSNETIAKHLQEYQEFASELPLEKRIELISDLVENFIPLGLKEETERLKRKGLNLDKEQEKKQKLSEEAPKIETSTEEFTEEKMKEMMQLVRVEDVYVQALQVKHPIIDVQ